MNDGPRIAEAASKAKRPTQMEEQITTQRNSLDRLESVVGELCSRLSPVVRNDRPVCQEKSVPDGELVPLADALRNSNNVILALRRTLQDTIDGLEL
jgi:hypothetical protein